jgi:hypothetical protein
VRSRACGQMQTRTTSRSSSRTASASVNPATAATLVSKYEWRSELIRSMLYCLNITLLAFLKPFERVYAMQSHLRDIRSFAKAGCGSSPRALLVDYALSLSGVDFAATR